MEALHMKRAPLVLAILLALSAGAGADPAGRPAAKPASVQIASPPGETGTEAVISRFSKKPVPRFETLRWAEVNGRTGPSLSSPIAWQYNRKGLPVMVVKESGEWYRVRDPAGDEVWIHMRMLAEGTTAIVTRTSILGNGPARGAEGVAEVGKGVLVEVKGCDESLCEVETAGYRGWMPRANLWGVSTAPAAP
jgi:SH3-like domain-containing protein